MQRFVAIVNGAAGGGRARARAREVLPALRDAGITLDIRETRAPGDATRIAREEYARGERFFLAVGGDGTSYEIVNGVLPQSEKDPITLASLPLGTGNSFLRDFGITSEEKAISALKNGRIHNVDVVRVTHRDGVVHYINLLSIGFSAVVGALTNRRFKPFGAAGYPLAVVTSLMNMGEPVFAHSLDGGAVNSSPSTLLSFSNSKFTGGAMMMAPPANVSDGVLDVIRVAPMGRVELLATFPKIYAGTHLSHPKVSHARAKQVVFSGLGKIDAMIDGEVLELQMERLDVLPGVLQVIA